MGSARLASLAALLALITPLWGHSSAFAASGDADSAFGDGGVVVTDVSFDSDSRFSDIGHDVIAQPDGRVVVVGTGNHMSDFAAVRYLSDGALDPSFSGDGVFLGSFEQWSGEQGQVAALQPDGRILIAGSVYQGDDWDEFGLMRLMPNGTLDRSFAGDGGVVTSLSPANDTPTAMVIQHDGKIVLAGRACVAECRTDAEVDDIVLVRFTTAGALDATFGTGGVAHVGINDSVGLAGLGMRRDGGLVLVGAFYRDGYVSFLAGRLANGQPDPAYGPSGRVEGLDLGGDYPVAMALQPDGRVVVSASSTDEGRLARFTPDGVLDPTFGAGGTLSGLRVGGSDLVVLADGRILSSAQSCPDGCPALFYGSTHFVVRSVTPAGLPDPLFGQDGEAEVLVRSSGASARALAVQPDGGVLVAGNTGIADDFAVVRFLGDTPPAPGPTPLRADLSVTQRGEPDPVRAGETLTYRVTLQNHGPDPASEVVLEDALPPTATYLSATTAGGSCSQPSAASVVCVWDALGAGSEQTAEIKVVPGSEGQIVNTVRVAAREDDPGPGLNLSTVVTSVLPACTLNGTDGSDLLIGTPGRDVICSGGGDDIIDAGNGPDFVYGEGGNDVLRGAGGRDTLVGGDGDDVLFGVDGVSGNDELAGGPGSNQCPHDSGDQVTKCGVRPPGSGLS